MYYEEIDILCKENRIPKTKEHKGTKTSGKEEPVSGVVSNVEDAIVQEFKASDKKGLFIPIL